MSQPAVLDSEYVIRPNVTWEDEIEFFGQSEAFPESIADCSEALMVLVPRAGRSAAVPTVSFSYTDGELLIAANRLYWAIQPDPDVEGDKLTILDQFPGQYTIYWKLTRASGLTENVVIGNAMVSRLPL